MESAYRVQTPSEDVHFHIKPLGKKYDFLSTPTCNGGKEHGGPGSLGQVNLKPVKRLGLQLDLVNMYLLQKTQD